MHLLLALGLSLTALAALVQAQDIDNLFCYSNTTQAAGDCPALSPLLALQPNLNPLQRSQLEGHQGNVNEISFSPDGQRIATAGEDGTARIWNLQGQQLALLDGHQGEVYGISFSPDGQRIATYGLVDGTARIWNLQGQQLALLEGH